MKVYHGSYTRIETIDLTKAEENKDFGKGFYVTNILKHASRWAQRIAVEHNAKPVVTEFEFYETAFTDSIYRVLRFPNPNEEWVRFIMKNRNPNISKPAHDYDIVEGPIANDWVTSRIKQYEKGHISMETLVDSLTYREDTHQICLCTNASLSAMELLNNDCHIKAEEIAKSVIVALAETDMDRLITTDMFYVSETFAQLTDYGTELYLRPWQEIYEMLKKELILLQ